MNPPPPLPKFVSREQLEALIAERIEAERNRCAGIATGWLNAARTPAGRKVARGILRQIENGDPGF